MHSSASEAGLRLCLARAAFEARIIEASWYGDATPTLPLGEAFHARRLRLVASQVGAVAGPMRGRRSHAERLGLALALLADARFDALLEGPTAFADLPAKGLLRGQVGTVVESLSPGVFEVEFSDDQGRTYAQLAIDANQLLVLHYQPQQAA